MNNRAKKELLTEEKLDIYKKKSVRKIIIEFKNVLRMYYRNEELLNEFNAWHKKNNDKERYKRKLIAVKATHENGMLEKRITKTNCKKLKNTKTNCDEI